MEQSPQGFLPPEGRAESHHPGENDEAESSKFPPDERKILDDSWFDMYDTREDF